MSEFDKKIKSWASNNGFEIANNICFEKDLAYMISESLCWGFEKYGLIQYAETGTNPAEYLPSVIREYLSQLGNECWQLDKVSSADQWESADVILSNKETGKKYAFTLLEVNNSDWVSGDLSAKMKKISQEKIEQALLTFYSDDPYLVVAIPKAAAQELESIIDQYTKPY